MRSASLAAGCALLGSLLVAGCSTAPGSGARAENTYSGTVINAAASINAWGSILSQLGGSRVRTVSIITNPNTDPHDYEPTPADARVIASSALFVENGVGYDPWAEQVLKASPDQGRLVIDVGKLTGTPENGNPHRWYSPPDVEQVANQITTDLQRLDPADASYFQALHRQFEDTELAGYHRLINEIRTRFAGTPVGASESIFAPLAQALGLDLITPASFLKAISVGTDPAAADKATVDAQIAEHAIKVYVFNSQNATPDVAAQVTAARLQKIPVTTVTETLTPRGATFQNWQVAQLMSLKSALAAATGR